jgi:acetyl esterase/lipase
MVVAPGGAFHFLMMDYEGFDMARWLVGQGITAFVLKYRLMSTPDADDEVEAFRADLHKKLGAPSRDETAPPAREFMREVRLMGEEDGRQAIRFVRAHAAEFGVAADRIGIAGYSAGGGPALGSAMQHDAMSRPDFVVGVYPAYRGDLVPPASPPPLFLTIADDDTQVAPMSATRLYEAWHKAGGAAELHVFGNGAHGFGMLQEGHLSDIWTLLLLNWMRARKLV